MQDCKLTARFKTRPELLLGKWALLLRRGLNPLPHEVVHVTQRTVTLTEMKSWGFSGASPEARPPKTINVPLQAFLDVHGGFSYLGPRSKFEWIRAGALAEAKSFQRHRRFGTIGFLPSGDIRINLIPPSFREYAEGVRLVSGARPEFWATGPVWRIAQDYKPVRKNRSVVISDWGLFFRLRYPELAPPLDTQDPNYPWYPNRDVNGPETTSPPFPDAKSPATSIIGPSHWERLRTPPEDP